MSFDQRAAIARGMAKLSANNIASAASLAIMLIAWGRHVSALRGGEEAVAV